MWIRVLAGLGALLGGCDWVFRIDTLPSAIDVDARLPVVGCSPMSLLADDFTNDSPGPLWQDLYGSGGADPFVVAGQLVVPMQSDGYGVVGSGYYYDLRDDHFQVEVDDDGGLSGANIFELSLVSQRPDHLVRFVRTGTSLSFERVEGANRFETGSVPYDPTMHRFLRIAQTGDVTTWETSSTGQAYVVQASVTGLDYLSFVKMTLSLRKDAGSPPYNVMLDNVNGGQATGEVCPAFQLHDTFDGLALAEQWARSAGTDGLVEQSAGSVNFTYGPNVQSSLTLAPSTVYDLRGGAFAVEVPSMIDTSSMARRFWMSVTTLTGESSQLEQSGGQLSVLKNDSSLVNRVPYLPIDHRWWRCREDGGALVWETSPDGKSYTELGRAAVSGLGRVGVALRGSGQDTAATTASVDNFNVPPPP